MKHSVNIFPLILFCTMSLASSHCFAGKFQDQQTILESARGFLEQHTAADHGRPGEVRMGRLDPRLRLAACGVDLQPFLPPGARSLGNTTVGVRCPDAGGWTIYATARISLYGQVLVTSQPLARGAPLTMDRLRLVERDLATLPRGYFDDPKAVLGQLAKRPLNVNTVLGPNLLEAPRLVLRGEQVTLIAGRPGFSVRSLGEALADGAVGEQIRVKAKGSKRIVEGRVISTGVVKVTL